MTKRNNYDTALVDPSAFVSLIELIQCREISCDF